MIKVFSVLLIIALLIPGAAISQDALPYLAVGAAPCQFNFDFRLYGTIWNFTSIGAEIQRVKMYASYPDGLTGIYDQLLQSGEQRYVEEWNNISHCKPQIWIPKVEGTYVAS